MMEHTVALLKDHRFQALISLLYFQPEIIERYFKDGSEFGVTMAYVTATEDLGTPGAVKNAEANMPSKAEAHLARYREILATCIKEAGVEAVG